MLVLSTKIPLKNTTTQEQFLEKVFNWICSTRGMETELSIEDLNAYDKMSHKNFELKNDTSCFEIRHYKDSKIELSACRLTRIEPTKKTYYDAIMIDECGKKYLLIQSDIKYNVIDTTKFFKFSNDIQSTNRKYDKYIKSLVVQYMGSLTEKDDEIPTTWTAVETTQGNGRIRDYCARAISGKTNNVMPILYVSRPKDGNMHFEYDRLAKNWQGIVHVIYESDTSTQEIMRQLTDGKNQFNGNVAVYFPQTTYYRYYKPDDYSGNYEPMYQKIFNDICQFMVHNHSTMKYTWNAINVLQARQELDKVLNNKEASKEDLLSKMRGYEDALENEKVRHIQEENAIRNDYEEKLREKDAENKEMYQQFWANSGKYYATQKRYEGGFFKLGTEHEIFQGEAKDLLRWILNKVKEKNIYAEDSHPYALIKSMLEANTEDGTTVRKINEAIEILRQDGGLTEQRRNKLSAIGFSVREGDHYVVRPKNDPRYGFTVSKSSSDHRANRNLTSEVKNQLKIDIDK